jgi:hypothetical protein
VALTLALAGFASLRSHTAQAQDVATSRARYSFASVGLIPGQSLRVSVFQPPPVGDVPPPVNDRVRILVLAPNGDTLADSGDIAWPPGPTRRITVPREKLARAGEDDTGRLQVRVVVLVTSGGEYPPGPSVPSVEVLTTTSGRTVVFIGNPGVIQGFNPQPDPPLAR